MYVYAHVCIYIYIYTNIHMLGRLRGVHPAAAAHQVRRPMEAGHHIYLSICLSIYIYIYVYVYTHMLTIIAVTITITITIIICIINGSRSSEDRFDSRVRQVHLLRVFISRVLESNFPGGSLYNSTDMRIPTP